jgi:hypothetical protein
MYICNHKSHRPLEIPFEPFYLSWRPPTLCLLVLRSTGTVSIHVAHKFHTRKPIFVWRNPVSTERSPLSPETANWTDFKNCVPGECKWIKRLFALSKWACDTGTEASAGPLRAWRRFGVEPGLSSGTQGATLSVIKYSFFPACSSRMVWDRLDRV